MSRRSRQPPINLFKLIRLTKDEPKDKGSFFRSNKEAYYNPFVIASIGDLKRDDIPLSKSKYRGRCYFTMTKAGDLMLYDAGNSLEQDSGEIRPTKLTATDEGDHVSKFRIRGIGDSCVLPFSQYYKYTIELPSGDKFALVWGKDVDWRNLQATRDILRAEYRIRSISAPDEDEGKKNSRDFDIKLHPRPWILRVQDSTIFLTFSRRSTTKAGNIAGAPKSSTHFMTAKLSSMVTDEDHKRDVGQHLREFLVHILSALRLIHSHNMSHGNVELDSIVLKKQGSSMSFLLAGLGMTSKSYSSAWVGDPRYMAPELLHNARQKEYNGPPADIYSFGVALLEFLDICPKDDISDWHGWQVESGHRKGHDIGDRRFSRVQSLRTDRRLNNPTLENMLDPDPLKRPSADEALRGLAQHYKFQY
ncbi:hypothetical protein MY11210_006421 [Beauveria gryllotalpidicola]